MTDFSHLHALEERAVRIMERIMTCKRMTLTGKLKPCNYLKRKRDSGRTRISRTEDMSTDDLCAGLIEKHESEVVREVNYNKKRHRASGAD